MLPIQSSICSAFPIETGANTGPEPFRNENLAAHVKIGKGVMMDCDARRTGLAYSVRQTLGLRILLCAKYVLHLGIRYELD